VAARAWILNLDADLELRADGPYTRSRAIETRLASLRASLTNLVRPSDVVIDEGGVDAAGLEGHAFCMTRRARERLETAGALPVAAPPLEVIRRANHRRFCAELGQRLPGAIFATSFESVERALGVIDSPLGALLKRPFAFAGRGQRRVSSVLTDADRAWLAGSLEEGVQVEPRVSILIEHSVHGVIVAGGAFELGPVVVQECDPSGAWRATRAPTAGELSAEEIAGALAEAERVAQALARAGYFGPFGVDGFVYQAESGRQHQPRGEINARYTMGWSLG